MRSAKSSIAPPLSVHHQRGTGHGRTIAYLIDDISEPSFGGEVTALGVIVNFATALLFTLGVPLLVLIST